MSEPSLPELEAERDRLFAQLSVVGDFRRGSVSENWRLQVAPARHQAVAACATCPGPGGRSGGVADAGGSVSEAMHALSRRRI